MINQFADLHSLKKALDSKILGSVLLGVSFTFILDVNVFNLILKLVVIACFLFVPFMLYVLYLNNKKNWIIGFFIIMTLAFFPSLFTFDNIIIQFSVNYLPLIFFLLFCFFLNIKIGEWLIESQYWSTRHKN